MDYIGGDTYWASGISLFTPVPRIPKHWDVRSHFFINGGRLIQRGPSSLVDLLHKPSIAAGFGLVYRHPAARIELNFVVPISAVQGDGFRKGLEVGIGASFM